MHDLVMLRAPCFINSPNRSCRFIPVVNPLLCIESRTPTSGFLKHECGRKNHVRREGSTKLPFSLVLPEADRVILNQVRTQPGT